MDDRGVLARQPLKNRTGAIVDGALPPVALSQTGRDRCYPGSVPARSGTERQAESRAPVARGSPAIPRRTQGVILVADLVRELAQFEARRRQAVERLGTRLLVGLEPIP